MKRWLVRVRYGGAWGEFAGALTMGEARRRGTYEQRRAQAIARREALERKFQRAAFHPAPRHEANTRAVILASALALGVGYGLLGKRDRGVSDGT